MHELGIAQAIIDVVEEEARRAGARRVVSITLSIGELSGVVEHYLRFCFPMVAAGTLAEGAELVVEPVPGEGYCHACERSFHLSGLLDRCPGCGGFANEVRAGQELEVADLEVE